MKSGTDASPIRRRLEAALASGDAAETKAAIEAVEAAGFGEICDSDDDLPAAATVTGVGGGGAVSPGGDG